MKSIKHYTQEKNIGKCEGQILNIFACVDCLKKNRNEIKEEFIDSKNEYKNLIGYDYETIVCERYFRIVTNTHPAQLKRTLTPL